MSFSFSFIAIKRERKERKERENTLPLPTLLRALNQMDVASKELALFRSLSQLIAARSRSDCRSLLFFIFIIKN